MKQEKYKKIIQTGSHQKSRKKEIDHHSTLDFLFYPFNQNLFRSSSTSSTKE